MIRSEFVMIRRITFLWMFLFSVISLVSFVTLVVIQEREIKKLKNFTAKTEMVNLSHFDSVQVENIGVYDYDGEFVDFPDRWGVYVLRFSTIDHSDLVVFTSIDSRKKLADALKECK